MKKVTLMVAALLLVAGVSFGQGKGRGMQNAKGKAQQAQSKAKKEVEDSRDDMEEMADTLSKGKRHSYGRNKGDMRGRDFGRMRADSARLQGREHREHGEMMADSARRGKGRDGMMMADSVRKGKGRLEGEMRGKGKGRSKGPRF